MASDEVVVVCSLLLCILLVQSAPTRHYPKQKRNAQQQILLRLRRGLQYRLINGQLADVSQSYSRMCEIETTVKNSQAVFGNQHVYFPMTFVEEKCKGYSPDNLIPPRCSYDPNLDCVTQYEEKSFMKRPKGVSSCSTNWGRKCEGKTIKFTRRVAVGCECMIPL